ncbi:AsmA-like C-terminal domain-containing protein [Sulfurimonas paralvinellae]|uniref:DUF3971 domain-containing protein n=1 Tax=Sulfurimonas paralvinellae TaxID=317658 RepID=A0A7M1B7Q0_9BACT|nr:AsmA-like C-terminal domain-containing protein [Sulfurimonas paralvinellae]QOP45711.1 DUF3971 domain-containing protein [Sulfurimonas paralvinellae]
MKDKKVISIISKTYLAIISFLSFILLSLIVIFIVLQNGLYLEKVSIANLTIKNAYIKWNEKLNISIEELDIAKNKKKKAKLDYKDISRYLKATSQFFLLTESIVIKKLRYDNVTIHLKHNLKEKGFLLASSPAFNFDAHFKFYGHNFFFTIDKLQTMDNKVNINGSIVANMQEKKIYSKLHAVLNNDADLILYGIADRTHFCYTIETKKDIEHIRELVKLFGLPKEIKYWTVDAIDAPSVTLQKAEGFVQYNDIASAYRHLHLTATVNRLNYMYNPQLDAIHTQRTELEFLNGVLYIRPKEAYSYGMYLNKSWLKIDFTKPQEILTLHLLFDGMLNKNMLHILDTYHINLPFLQHWGKVATNLTLAVNLMTLDIDAHGSFFTKKANFDYLGLNIDIADTLIKLDNYDINITKMKAKYKDIADADVTVKYNAKHSEGSIDFNLTKVALTKNNHLDTTQKPLHISYKISPKGDKIIVEKSNWIVQGVHRPIHVSIDAVAMSFDLKTLQLTVPTTYFSIKNVTDGFITGSANMKSGLADFKADIIHFSYQGIQLKQSNAEMDLHYDKILSISSRNDIFLSINGSPYLVKELLAKTNGKHLKIEHTKLKIGKYINTEINADYDFKKRTADINLKDFILVNPNTKKILYYKKSIALDLAMLDKKIEISAKELQATFFLEDDKWILNLDAIGLIAKNSNFLRKYNISNGKISFYKRNDDKYTKFKGAMYFPYKLLTNKDKTVKKYNIKGYISKNQNIYFKVNDRANIKIAKNINITLNNSGVNVDELLKFINLLTKQAKNKNTNENSPNIFLDAKNSYLYVGNNRYIISEMFHLQYYNGITTAQLTHDKGKAGFKLENNNFHLYGSNFNDKFMEKLFSLSKFNGGSLDFSMNGALKDYTGIFYIKDTTIQDYVVLNNILAFINTVPSLATFSLPGYNRKGLHIENAYANFHAKDNLFNFSDIYLGSKEIKILGKGKASLDSDMIDLTLNLKTDLGSNLSKVPLVGYIIFDGQSISTTLKVTGKLTDPKVETMLARDIAVAPLNIILRTLTLPYKIVIDIADVNSSK